MIPKGPSAGSMMHEIFENISFEDYSADVDAVIVEGIDKYGFDSELTEMISENITEVLETEINLRGEKFSLSAIPESDMKKEMYFIFPVRSLSGHSLRHLYEKYADQAPEVFRRLDFNMINGYMAGFIDLLIRINGRYYVIDWKTNYLGDRLNDYSPERLQKAMKANMYHL
ncbi:MAG: hypothetical protein ACLFRY_13540, partial [Spirochaetia bacterium]